MVYNLETNDTGENVFHLEGLQDVLGIQELHTTFDDEDKLVDNYVRGVVLSVDSFKKEFPSISSLCIFTSEKVVVNWSYDYDY
jgi:hypothetical protein